MTIASALVLLTLLLGQLAPRMATEAVVDVDGVAAVEVVPSTGLVDGQRVDVRAPAGTFAPGAEVFIMQCLRSASTSDRVAAAGRATDDIVLGCGGNYEVGIADGDGALDVTYVVRRSIRPAEFPIWCAPDRCELLIGHDDGFVVVPIEFASNPEVGSRYTPITASRLVDTRLAGGAWGTPLPSGPPRSLTIAGASGGPEIPDGATAVTMTVTVTNGTEDSYLSVWRGGTDQPLPYSTVNFARHETVANTVTVALGDGGDVNIANLAGQTDVVLDVLGYWSVDGTLGFWRRHDMRIIDPAVGHVSSGAPLVVGVPIAFPGDVALLNIAATRSTAASYLSVHAQGEATSTSFLNVAADQTIANTVAVPVRSEAGDGIGWFEVETAHGSVDVAIDLIGMFNISGQERFHPLEQPKRLIDSRVGVGIPTLLEPGTPAIVQVGDVVPFTATGVVMNTTVTEGRAPSYLSVASSTPFGLSMSPSVNFGPFQTVANGTAPGMVDGSFGVVNLAGGVHVVSDVLGYFDVS